MQVSHTISGQDRKNEVNHFGKLTTVFFTDHLPESPRGARDSFGHYVARVTPSLFEEMAFSPESEAGSTASTLTKLTTL